MLKKICTTFLSIIFISPFFLSSTSHAKKTFKYSQNYLYPQKSTDSNTQADHHLNYYGGNVISSIKVVPVYWTANVRKAIQAVMNDFYSSYVNSKHMDWLSEYDTTVVAIDGRQGSGQHIQRGSSIEAITISPTKTGTKISDADIQKEIENQVALGILPKPDQNTLYAFHFPYNFKISIENEFSCSAFGGYHQGFSSQQYGPVYYAVLPDCSYPFGSDETAISTMTYVASHELIEAVTDANPTPGSQPAFPQAWNDSQGNEIADICNTGVSELVGKNRSYEISLEWSNSRNTCYDGN